jgi:hypothetical protein
MRTLALCGASCKRRSFFPFSLFLLYGGSVEKSSAFTSTYGRGLCRAVLGRVDWGYGLRG